MSRGRTTPCTLLPRTVLSRPGLRFGSPAFLRKMEQVCADVV